VQPILVGLLNNNKKNRPPLRLWTQLTSQKRPVRTQGTA
jgi:hypothetical protein